MLVRPVDVNVSRWECTLEGSADAPSLRLGMCLVDGLRQEDAEAIVATRARVGTATSIERLWRTSGIGVGALRRLASGDAFGTMGLDRQTALWHLRRLKDERLPLFDAMATDAASDEPIATLPTVSLGRAIKHDYDSVGLSLKAHPLSLRCV